MIKGKNMSSDEAVLKHTPKISNRNHIRCYPEDV
jgi:hypothetical protein